jgi:hypothetical protein
MSLVGVGLVSALLCLALAAPAGAQSAGNGLYEPFPSAGSKARAKRFVNELRPHARKVSGPELERGSFVGGALRPQRSGAASARAMGGSVPRGAIGWWLAPALLAICATPLLCAAAVRTR